MPQTSILSVQSSAGGVATFRIRLVGARSPVYRREIVEALKTLRAITWNRVSGACCHRDSSPRDARWVTTARFGKVRRENG
jgi:hypothetical protein